MATFYVDPSDVPSGTKLPHTIRCRQERVGAAAEAIVAELPGEGQVGLYEDDPYGAFVGYAIKEGDVTRFEASGA